MSGNNKHRTLPVNLYPSNKSAKAQATMFSGDQCYAKINGNGYYLTVPVNTLPMTPAIQMAHHDVLSNVEEDYCDIGERYAEPFSITPTDMLHLNYVILCHSMRVAGARNLWRATLPKYFCSFVRERIIRRDELFRVKVTTLKLIVDKINPFASLARVQGYYERDGLSRNYAYLYRLMWMSGAVVGIMQELAKNPERVLLNTDFMLEEANIALVSSNIQELCSYYAHKKLRFITDSQRYESNYLADMLFDRARAVYLLNQPFLNRTHSLNYARATVSSYVVRIITHYSKEENSRLVTVDGGDNNRFVQLNDNNQDAFDFDAGSVEDAILDRIEYLQEMGI